MATDIPNNNPRAGDVPAADSQVVTPTGSGGATCGQIDGDGEYCVKQLRHGGHCNHRVIVAGTRRAGGYFVQRHSASSFALYFSLTGFCSTIVGSYSDAASALDAYRRFGGREARHV